MPSANGSRGGGTWLRPPGGGQALTCPLLSACHAPIYASLYSHPFQEGGTGQLSWGGPKALNPFWCQHPVTLLGLPV